MPPDASPLDPRARHRRGRSARRSHVPQRRLGRILLGLFILAGLLTALPVDHAQAASRSGPPGEYIPKRVWQMNKNCVWAAGEMLLDKWTHGGLRVRQSVLRRASHDKKGGSSLYDLSRGIARVTGVRVPFSPGGGDTMTWWQLLDRLDRGGGAVLVGEYGDLSAHFTRWDRSFARRRNSSHAVYVQSYDRVRGRVWLMDPLADGQFQGEWIGVGALHRFATFRDGKVMAAATPARGQPRTAPLIDRAYRLGTPHLSGLPVAGATVGVGIGLAIAFDFPAPAAQRLVARWVPVPPQPTPPDIVGSGRPPQAADTARTPDGIVQPTAVEVDNASPPGRAGRHGFSLSLPVPPVAGRYQLILGLAEPGHRAPSRSFRPIAVEVVAPYAGSFAFPKMADLTVGQTFVARMTVTNIGTVDWRTPVRTGGPLLSEPVVQSHLVLTWRSATGIELPAGMAPAEIAPGHTAVLPVTVVAPADAGTWTLSVDIDNEAEGPLSATGRVLPTATVRVTPKAHVPEH